MSGLWTKASSKSFGSRERLEFLSWFQAVLTLVHLVTRNISQKSDLTARLSWYKEIRLHMFANVCKYSTLFFLLKSTCTLAQNVTSFRGLRSMPIETRGCTVPCEEFLSKNSDYLLSSMSLINKAARQNAMKEIEVSKGVRKYERHWVRLVF